MIGVLDYGLGNVKAFLNIYKHLGIPAMAAATCSDLRTCTRLILPGVGAFDYALHKLEQSNLRAELDDLVLTQGIPILGVCVGMQIMAQSSEEGSLSGLCWLDAEVQRLPTYNHYPLPHMGWNFVEPNPTQPLFNGIGHSKFYFLHSYYIHCHEPSLAIASASYSSQFTSAVSLGNIYGVQFHPEKSHAAGINLLQNFANI